MKRVLVTGGNGFVGRHCIRPLQELGFEVHLCDLQASTQVGSGDFCETTTHRANLMDERDVRGVLERVAPTHLLHLAWETSHGEFWTSPRNLDWVSASLRLFRLFQECGGIRVVAAGSCAEYEWGEHDLSEKIPAKPATLYGKSKNACRELLEGFAGGAKMSAAWGRVFFLYGPYEGRQKLVAAAINSLLRRNAFACSAGTQVRDFLHVRDVGRAFAALLNSSLEGPVNIASGCGVTLRTVLTIIGEILDVPELLLFGAKPAASFDPPRIVADAGRLQKELHFSPSLTLEAGLRDAVEWWARQPVES